jgi:hypothetical protein
VSSSIEKYDLRFLATSVERANPARETSFIEGMNHNDRPKATVFCTWKLFGNERTMKAIEKEFSSKGYTTILRVSKKGMKPKKPNFYKVINRLQKAVQSLG